MKKLVLSIVLVAFAVAVQAGDSACCSAAKPACCASDAKAQCTAGAKATSTANAKAKCTAAGTKTAAKPVKPLSSPKQLASK